MEKIQRLLSIANNQIGYKEGLANYNQYSKWYDGNPCQEWCAHFVSWCMFTAGFDLKLNFGHIKGFAYCPSVVALAKSTRRWYPVGQIRAGDLVFYDWCNCGLAHHVEIVEYSYQSYLTTIGGNTNLGQVQRLKRNSSILGSVRLI